ncbi:MAG: hypothetical protein ACK5O7_00510 [Holosporales bacterium]
MISFLGRTLCAAAVMIGVAAASDTLIMLDEDTYEQPQKPQLHWLSMDDIVHDALPFINLYREYVAEKIKYLQNLEESNHVYDQDPCCFFFNQKMQIDDQILDLEDYYDNLTEYYKKYSRISLTKPQQRRGMLAVVANFLKNRNLLTPEHEQELIARGILTKPWRMWVREKYFW